MEEVQASATVLETFPELTGIEDDQLREAVVGIWLEVLAESAWERIEDVPKNPLKFPDDRNLVKHTRSVTRMALAIAEIAHEMHGLAYDRDLLIAAANLHDVSKMVEFTPETESRVSRFGHLIQHGVYGAHKALAKGLPIDVVHNILVHTGGSRYLPQTWEALIVHYADFVDSDGLALDAGSPLLLKK